MTPPARGAGIEHLDRGAALLQRERRWRARRCRRRRRRVDVDVGAPRCGRAAVLLGRPRGARAWPAASGRVGRRATVALGAGNRRRQLAVLHRALGKLRQQLPPVSVRRRRNRAARRRRCRPSPAPSDAPGRAPARASRARAACPRAMPPCAMPSASAYSHQTPASAATFARGGERLLVGVAASSKRSASKSMRASSTQRAAVARIAREMADELVARDRSFPRRRPSRTRQPAGRPASPDRPTAHRAATPRMAQRDRHGEQRDRQGTPVARRRRAPREQAAASGERERQGSHPPRRWSSRGRRRKRAARGRIESGGARRGCAPRSGSNRDYPARPQKGRGTRLALDEDQRSRYFGGGRRGAVPPARPAACFALIASSRILMPSCDARHRLRERFLARGRGCGTTRRWRPSTIPSSRARRRASRAPPSARPRPRRRAAPARTCR